MSLDPHVIRSEPHTEIGNLIQRNVGALIERWSRRAVEEQPKAQRVHHAVLLDHFHDFLWALGRSLAESEPREANEHCLTATVHGEHRWEAGWSLTEVVRDYQILRLVILDFLVENLERPLGYREILAIGLALDEAIAASVVMYVNSREQSVREAEEQRATADKEAKERLQKYTEELQTADRRKNEFLAMLAHELRNPLAPIRNAAEVLRLQAPADPTLQWAQSLIERQVQQLTRMVDDLLDISRIARGKIRLEKEAVNLTSVVERAVEMVRPLVDSRKQRLTVSPAPGPMWLRADPARLTQVLVNLLTNAAKYTEEGGHVWLTAERADDQATIRVRDTGAGISAKLLPFIFEPYIQEERATERARGGLGIGLSLVRSLVELHGGSVQALSDGPGRGSEFVVRLPLLRQAPPSAAAAPHHSLSGMNSKPRRILVVDDNADSAESLALLLRASGHEVRTAYTGEAALQAAHSEQPEIILLDLGMPGLDGFGIARRLRKDAQLKQVSVIALTGYGQADDKRRTREAGFKAHLLKPVDLDELNAVLSQLEVAHDQRVSRPAAAPPN
jgi:signal transduction histidine kinase/ActR/RegA family two-component response regulator